MTSTNGSAVSPLASYEVNSLGDDVGPLHKRLLAYFNEMHEATAAGDTETIQELEQVVPPLLDEFEATEALTTPNPGWLSGKMRAGWYVACGRYEEALAFEYKGWLHAVSEADAEENHAAKARRKSVSASNIADELWRLGRATEGLPWARLSVDLWPSNTINHLVLAITAYHAGLHDEADQMIERLRQLANFGDASDILSECMSFEQAFHEMTALPSVRRLLQDMEVMP